jgi:hypothetical protein
MFNDAEILKPNFFRKKSPGTLPDGTMIFTFKDQADRKIVSDLSGPTEKFVSLNLMRAAYGKESLKSDSSLLAMHSRVVKHGRRARSLLQRAKRGKKSGHHKRSHHKNLKGKTHHQMKNSKKGKKVHHHSASSFLQTAKAHKSGRKNLSKLLKRGRNMI